VWLVPPPGVIERPTMPVCFSMTYAATPDASCVVWAVYDWEVPEPAGMDDETILARLLALDLARGAEQMPCRPVGEDRSSMALQWHRSCTITALVQDTVAAATQGVAMDAKALKGMAVVSLQEGTKLGQIEQPLFDMATRQLGALNVSGDAGSFVVPFTQIQQIGSDAVTVTSSQVTQTPSTGSALGSLVGLHELGKLKIVDQAGTFLGTISDVDVDPASGQITRLTAHKGGLLGMGGTTTSIDAGAILMVGPELLTVTTAATSDPAGS
jgi:sporulation protein YlmC with PRC-barrel domain